ncbi:SDR family oxidoreductase [Oceanobacillus oncorhynchi]|uniref:SDR family oxidoreductase n=1 Tax=Oceanobacillus oncorhynchi TaxID=545501 RepID=UPI0034D7BA7C
MKNVLITGGGNGIGCSIAKRFIQENTFKVFVVDNSFSELEKVPFYNDIFTFRLDVNDAQKVEDTIKNILVQHGGIDILINNVGISPKENGIARTIENINLDEWNKVISTNLTSAFLFIKHTLPSMKDKNWGRIITISSQTARTAAKIAGLHYATTKSGLVGLSRQIAAQYGQYNITSNCIAPGRIESDMTNGVSNQVNEIFLEQNPIKRMGKKEEVASLVEYLAKDEAGYITGATIDINGGSFIG